jgi:hypothetical protein
MKVNEILNESTSKPRKLPKKLQLALAQAKNDVVSTVNRWAQNLQDEYGPLEDWPGSLGQELSTDAENEIENVFYPIFANNDIISEYGWEYDIDEMDELADILNEICTNYPGTIQEALCSNMLQAL